MSALIYLAIALLIGLALVVLAIGLRRRRSGLPPTNDTATLRVTRAAAAVFATIALIATVVSVVDALATDTVAVDVPTQTFWPTLPAEVTATPGSDARVVGGGFTRASLEVTGLSLTARLFLAAGYLLQGLTLVLLAAAVALLAHRLLAGDPFRPTMSRTVMVAATAMVVGGFLWQVCLGIGQSIASREALFISGWGWKEPQADPTALLPEPTVMFTIDFWPIATGLALAAVAAAFRYGERLQRDTTGLI